MPNVLFSIILVGASGLVAQVLLLRELLVSFYGNELTIGLILANWIALEGLGAFLVGRWVDRARNRINIFISLQAVFSFFLPLSVYLCRVFKSLCGVPTGETIGLSMIFFSSLAIILPVAFSHGGLFSVMGKIFQSPGLEAGSSIGKVYAWETAGTLFGGLLFTYLFIPYFDSFQITFIIGTANLAICLIFLKDIKVLFRWFILFMICAVGLLYFGKGAAALSRNSIKKQWRQGVVLDDRNSVYGNIVVTRQLEQYTFFYNGIPVITTPYPDKQFVEDFGHLPLLFHPDPKQVLIISHGAGGLIHEILKHPVERIDYAEIDPLLIDMVKKFPTSLTESELKDARVRVMPLDGRLFLRIHPRNYDVILIGLSSPQDLSSNRFFTQEFFALVRSRLIPDGVLAFCLPGSLAYYAQPLKDLNACIENSLKAVFPYVRVIPGDCNIFLASSSPGLTQVSSGLMTSRLAMKNISSALLLPEYIDYRLSQSWQDWFYQSLKGATKERNRDLKPVAVFAMLKYWNKKFAVPVARVLDIFEGMGWPAAFLVIILIAGLFFYRMHSTRNKNSSIVYALISTGFFGMLANLILIFGFQVFYGYLYQWIGLLMSVFMAGTALGSAGMTKWMKKTKSALILFAKCEFLIMLFSVVLGFLLIFLSHGAGYAPIIFSILLLISGFFLGMEFPLAVKIYLEVKQGSGRATGILYGADLLGGWLAGLLGGIVIIPLWGVFTACLIMAAFKLSSLLLLVLSLRFNSTAVRSV